MDLEVHLSKILRSLNGDSETVKIPPCLVEDLLFKIAAHCPNLGSHLFNKRGELSGFMNIYVNGIRYDKLERSRRLMANDHIEVMTSLVGG